MLNRKIVNFNGYTSEVLFFPPTDCLSFGRCISPGGFFERFSSIKRLTCTPENTVNRLLLS